MRVTSINRDRWGRPYSLRDTVKPDRRKRKPSSRKKKNNYIVDKFFTCRMKTTGDWYPNLEGPEKKLDEVEVSIIGWAKHYKKGELAYRICIWGGDDHGMEFDYLYEDTSPSELFKIVMDMPEPLNKGWLEDQGFYPA